MSLCLGFLLCKVEMIIMFNALGVLKIKLMDICKTLKALFGITIYLLNN